MASGKHSVPSAKEKKASEKARRSAEREKKAAAKKQQRSASRRRHRKASGCALPLVVVLVMAALACAAAYFIVPMLTEEPNEIAEGTEVTFTVPEGASATQIADILVDSHLVVTSSAFLDEVKKQDSADKLKPGTYKIVGGTTVKDIVEVIASGKTGYVLTVPEGYTLTQIAALVKDVCGISSSEFETLANTAADFEVEYSFLKGVYQGSMEGFLFPSTYEVPYDATASDVIKLMLDAYQDNVKGVSMKYAKKKNLSSYDVLTLASIIEKESRKDSDKDKISAVFYNRMKAGMALGSDVTTYYAVGKDLTEELTTEDLASDSPYNTRNEANKGLPPSPICSPGLESIKAAAKPADTKSLYFFYSSKKDKVMFYETLDEFNAAYAKYQ